jgi:hypothetical protein
MNIDAAEAFNVLKHYGIHVATGNADHSGTEISISGDSDLDAGRTIAIRGGTSSFRRMVPLGEAGAAILADHLNGNHHPANSENGRRMLEHVLLRASNMFVESGIDTFHLDVRLHDNSYTVVHASMTAKKPPHLKKRLSPHAHDRKGTAYRPSGRQ